MSSDQENSYSYRDKGYLVVAQNTLLSRLMGKSGVSSGGKRSWIYQLLFNTNDGLASPLVQRMWDHRVGGLVLYALGMRTSRDIQRVERERRRRNQNQQ